MIRFPKTATPPYQQASPDLALDIAVLNRQFLNSPCLACGRARIECCADPCKEVLDATAREVEKVL